VSFLSDGTDGGRDRDSLRNDCSGLRLSRTVLDASSTRGDRGHGSRVDGGRGHLDRW
jgi:hypothetical protein